MFYMGFLSCVLILPAFLRAVLGLFCAFWERAARSFSGSLRLYLDNYICIVSGSLYAVLGAFCALVGGLYVFRRLVRSIGLLCVPGAFPACGSSSGSAPFLRVILWAYLLILSAFRSWFRPWFGSCFASGFPVPLRDCIRLYYTGLHAVILRF